MNTYSFARKGQGGEIVGLLVVVVMIIIGSLLYVRLSRVGSGSGLEDIRGSTEAYNLLKAMIRFNVGEKMEDLSYRCYNGDCKALEETAEKILKASLPEGREYWFTLEGGEERLMEIGDCKIGTVGSYPFTVEGVYFEARLRTC